MVGLVSDLQLKAIDTLALKLEQAKIDLSLAKTDGTRIAAQNMINKLTEDLNEKIAEATIDYRKMTNEAGKAFASSISDSLTTGMIDLLSGKADEGEDALQTFSRKFIDSLTNTVIKTFVDGLMAPLTGENSPLMQSIKNFGSSIFSTAFGISTPVSGNAAAKMATGADPSVGIFQGMWDTLKSGFTGMLGYLGPFGAWLSGLLGLTTTKAATDAAADVTKIALETTNTGLIITAIGADTLAVTTAISVSTGAITAAIAASAAASSGGDALKFLLAAGGGRIAGPGTGTSDSIPAMLSNNEFVVNAKAARKFSPLLEAINNNRMTKFADGGAVNTSILAKPMQSSLSSNGQNKTQSTQQVFQINITGDVSRQTRAEIQRMLPNIANGVNSYNKEKG